MSKKLNELKPYDKGGLIEARVYRKWIDKNPKYPIPTGYSCMLLAREGNAIQANMDFVDRDHFDKLIEVGSCYKISDYTCEYGKQWMMTVEYETILKFGKSTKLEHITDEGFPIHYFNFVSFNQLLPRLNKHKILTDYIACLRSVGDLKKSGNPNKNTIVWRILQLENLKYQIKYDVNPPLVIRRQPFDDLELEKMRNRYPLRTLLDQNPKRYMTDKFTTDATIVEINTRFDWFYIACSECSKKLIRTNGLLECQNHGPIKTAPKHMYNFRASIADEISQISATFFTPVVDALMATKWLWTWDTQILALFLNQFKN